MIPPRRPWVLECACGHLRRILRDQLMVCDTCDLIPTTQPRRTP